MLWVMACCAQANVIINEIHYDPPTKTDQTEFVELYNTGPGTVDLSGWRFTSGISYTIAPSTLLPAGGYLVVSENPDRLSAAFGAASLGPYDGFLSGDGEQVRLRDPTDEIVDEVTYGVGSPWPTRSAGGGSSMELIHPSLDNDLGGSWRASGLEAVTSRVLLAAQSPMWRYRKGTSEASSPTDAWRGSAFVEDTTWSTGRTPIGYGDNDDHTVLGDMQGGYSSVFLRHAIVITNAADLASAYRLRVYVDDGCIIWLNGHEVARPHMPAGDHPYHGTANNHESTWEDIEITQVQAELSVGTNILAVHGFNQSLTSSDFSIDAELLSIPGSTGAGGPSPGLRNREWSTDAPPQARRINHTPQQPTTTDNITIRAKVTDPDGVQSVMLGYQVVLPGSYLPAWLALDRSTLMTSPTTALPENPAFNDPANWIEVPMFDDGAGADAIAGDDMFTAVIPAQVTNRTLVRYRITVTDTLGASVRLPYDDDPSLNYACYVYDGVPDYDARSSVAYGSAHTYPTEKLTSTPVYHILTLHADLMHAFAYTDSYGDWKISKSNLIARRKFNWECAFVYEGTVYDHVLYRLRQSNDRYSQDGKRPLRFRFNKGNELKARDQFGRAYPTTWRTMNVVNGIRFSGTSNGVMPEGVTFQLFRMYGVAAPFTHMFHLRIVDDLEETDQYYGDFYGHYLAFEDFDPRFKDAHGLPDGNMYKLRDGFTDGNDLKQAQGRFSVLDDSDYDNIRVNLLPTQSTNWLNDHVDYENVYRYHSVVEGTRCYDNGYFGYGNTANKNQMWFFNLEGSSNVFGRAQVHPHDTDSAWSPGYSSLYGNSQFKESFTLNGGKPAYEIELRNHYREFRDLIWQTDVVYPLIDEHARFVRELSKADQDRWNGAPADAGANTIASLQERIEVMRSIAFVVDYNLRGEGDPIVGGRAGALDIFSGEGDDATSIPDTPIAFYTGVSNFPVNGLTFACSMFSDPQGGDTFSAMQWRAGEVTDPHAPAYHPDDPLVFEIESVWESSVYTTFEQSMQLPAAAVREGHAYRVRVRMKDNTGRWSHWSPPVAFVAGAADGAADLIADLRVTEVMYHPAGGEANRDLEFIEFQNTGTNELALGGVAITEGVDFDFPAMTLAPGAMVLVVRDLAAFSAAYGPGGVLIAGEYGGKLADGGEEVRVRAGRGGAVIAEFNYGDGRGWPPAPDGTGHSLVPCSLDRQDDGRLDYGGNWRASTFRGGSPGVPDPNLPPTGIVINELAAHTDYSGGEPWQDSNDWIELFNRAETDRVFDTHWYLSDDGGELDKWALPTGSLGSSNWVLFTEVDHFHPSPTSGFGLNKAGEQIFLSYLPGGPLDRVVDAVRFMGQPSGATLGRYRDGVERWTNLIPTPTEANALGPESVRIDEIMYHPNPDSAELEYLELLNRSGSPIALWGDNQLSWRITGGIDFAFPPNTTMGADERLVLVGFDPADRTLRAAFLATYGVLDGGIQLFGPYAGRLSNHGERVALERPQAPDTPGDPVSWILVDEVIYFDDDPWVQEADGEGLALQRKAGFGWGNDPEAWVGGLAPNPGIGALKVALTTPVNGTEYVAPCTIPIEAVLDERFVESAGPAVEFFANGASLGTDTLAPYTLTFTCPAVATDYVVFAVLTDNASASTTQVSRITVYTNQPTVGVTTNRILNARFYGDLALDGEVVLDGLPAHLLSTRWLQAAGPGFASFDNEQSPSSTVTFSAPGEYTLLLITEFGGRALTNRVVVRALDANTLNRVPYRESFETFDLGRSPVGTAGWYGTGSDVATIDQGSQLTSSNLPILDVPHERALRIDQSLVNRFEGTGGQTNLWIDALVECRRWNGDTLPEISAAEQFAVLVNSNGHLLVWHDQGAQDGWTELTSVTVTNGQWTRITAQADYTPAASGIRLWVDDIPIISPVSLFSLAGTNTLALTRIELTGAGAVDDLVVEDYDVLRYRKLTASAGPHGSVEPSGDILVPISSGISITASASNYYHVAQFDVDGIITWTGATSTTAYVFSNVIARHTLEARFDANRATHDVPHWWLAASHPAWTNNFDSLALGDFDVDGSPTWQEYIAGTHPTNAASRFTIGFRPAPTDPSAVDLVWHSVTGRTYTAHMATNLNSDAWSPQDQRDGNGSEIILRYPDSIHSSRYFRVEVERHETLAPLPTP